MRAWLFLAGLNGLLAVGMGALAWHKLGGEQMSMMGSQYQMWHALALAVVAWLAERGRQPMAVRVAGWSFSVGIVLFSGTLYHFAWFGDVLIPGAAPLGGGLLILGWGAIGWVAVRD